MLGILWRKRGSFRELVHVNVQTRLFPVSTNCDLLGRPVECETNSMHKSDMSFCALNQFAENACSLPTNFLPNVIGTGQKACIRGGSMNLFDTCDVQCAEGWRLASTDVTTKYSCLPQSIPGITPPTMVCEGLASNICNR